MCELQTESAPSRDATPSMGEFVDALEVAINSRRIYRHDHPRVAASLRTLAGGLARLLARRRTDRLEIGLADNTLFFEGRPLLGVSRSAPRLIWPLARLGAGGLAFEAGATEADFRILAELLGQRRLEALDFRQVNLLLHERECNKIQLLPPIQQHEGAGIAGGEGVAVAAGAGGVEVLEVPLRIYQRLVDLLQDAMVRACHGDTVHLDEGKAFVDAILEHLKGDPKGISQVCHYEQYDAYTFGHSIRVCALALDLARTLVSDRHLLHRIGLAALFHDIGKARIDPSVLLYRGRLDEEQLREMRRHTLFGAEILLESGADPLSVAIAFGHHKTWDGLGYPRTRHEAPISLATRLVRICDVYEALTAVRPYKESMSPARAYRVMMRMARTGGHFDERLLGHFIGHQGLYPTGSTVRLDSGAIARVEAQTGSVAEPVVTVEVSEAGRPVAPEARCAIDLSRTEETAVAGYAPDPALASG